MYTTPNCVVNLQEWINQQCTVLPHRPQSVLSAIFRWTSCPSIFLTNDTCNNTQVCYTIFVAVESERPVEAKRTMTELVKGCREVCPSSSEEVHSATSVASQSSSAESSMTRIPLPLLSGSVEAQYRADRTEEATTLVWNCDKLKCDEPLQLRLPLPSKQGTPVDCDDSSPVHFSTKSDQTCMIDKSNAFNALIAAYDDDADEQ